MPQMHVRWVARYCLHVDTCLLRLIERLVEIMRASCGHIYTRGNTSPPRCRFFLTVGQGAEVDG